MERIVDRDFMPVLHTLIRDAVAGHGYGYAEGGDEFVCLLRNATVEMAEAFANSLLEKIRSTSFAVEQQKESVTASCGVASVGEWGVAKVSDEANRAKREAKDAGKDRVKISRPGPA